MSEISGIVQTVFNGPKWSGMVSTVQTVHNLPTFFRGHPVNWGKSSSANTVWMPKGIPTVILNRQYVFLYSDYYVCWYESEKDIINIINGVVEISCRYYKCKVVGSQLAAKLCAEFKFKFAACHYCHYCHPCLFKTNTNTKAKTNIKLSYASKSDVYIGTLGR